MNCKSFLISFVLSISTLLFSQHSLGQTCATDELHAFLLETDSSYRSHYFENQAILNQFIQQNDQARSSTNTLIIPVVVHVFHLGEAIGTGNNISDSQILGAIQGLNDRFANTNGLGVDFNMQFCLAVRDPNNQPTNGINRINASNVEGYSSGGINYSTNACGANENNLKSLSRWPVNNYYNIWVVNKICGNYAGYAYYPNGGVNDGTVMARQYMTSSSITLSHELGHGFNIMHTFNGDGSNQNCPSDVSCIDNGDRICDTPPHKQGDCGGTNPCTTDGIWDNSRRNFMSYCGTRNRFTEGQRERARAAAILNPRLPLLSSTACIPVTDIDIGITQVIAPLQGSYSASCNDNSLHPVITIRNFGLLSIQNFTVHTLLNNQDGDPYEWNGELLPNAAVSITLPLINPNPGENVIRFRVENPNNVEDGFSGNNEMERLFVQHVNPYQLIETLEISPVSCHGATNGSASFSYFTRYTITEDFEHGIGEWIFANGAQPNKWIIGQAASNNGNHSIYISDNGSDFNFDNTKSSYVHVYKDFYFPSWAQNITIKFDFLSGSSNTNAELRVFLTPLDVIPAPGNFNTGSQIGEQNFFNQPEFAPRTIQNIDNNAGQFRRLKFTWRNTTAANGSFPVALDNISISYENRESPLLQWSTGDSTSVINNLPSGNYSVTANNQYNCIIVQDFLIEEPDAPIFSIEASNSDIICQGESVTLTAIAENSFVWNSGETSPIIEVSQSGIYFIELTEGDCIYRSDSIFITVSEIPSFELNHEGENLISPQFASMQWYLNNTPIDGATDSILTPFASGVYSLEVTNEDGCSSFSAPFDWISLTDNSMHNTQQVSIYPNPANHFIYITSTSTIEQIRVFDAAGALVYNEISPQTKISIEHFAKGVYIVEITSKEGLHFKKLFLH